MLDDYEYYTCFYVHLPEHLHSHPRTHRSHLPHPNPECLWWLEIRYKTVVIQSERTYIGTRLYSGVHEGHRREWHPLLIFSHVLIQVKRRY
jgi:hypothetical protein